MPKGRFRREREKEKSYTRLKDMCVKNYEELASTTHDQSDSKTFVKDLLLSHLPASKRDRIETEVQKTVKLTKTREEKFTKKEPRVKKTHLSAREKRTLKLFSLKNKNLKYEDFVPLHNLWKEYIKSYLHIDSGTGWSCKPGDNKWEQFTLQLMRADFHGCLITVTRSKTPSIVGKCGIVVMDTKNTFKIITRENKLITLPKECSIFSFSLGDELVTIFGRHLSIRPSERSVKKMKNHVLFDL